MSKFNTRIPVEIADILGSLPKGSYVWSVSLVPPMTDANRADIMRGDVKQEVVLSWENTNYESGLTVPTDFPITAGQRLKLPEGVRDARKPKPATSEQPKPENAPTPIVAPLKPIQQPYYMDGEAVAKAVAEGKKIEFQGIEIGWKPFNPPADVYRSGYFYRLVESKTVDKPESLSLTEH